jgi:hypothetical protein
MSSDEDAEKLLSTLNVTSFMERILVVNEAQPKTDRIRARGRGRKRSDFGRGREPDNWRYR